MIAFILEDMQKNKILNISQYTTVTDSFRLDEEVTVRFKSRPLGFVMLWQVYALRTVIAWLTYGIVM